MTMVYISRPPPPFLLSSVLYSLYILILEKGNKKYTHVHHAQQNMSIPSLYLWLPKLMQYPSRPAWKEISIDGHGCLRKEKKTFFYTGKCWLTQPQKLFFITWNWTVKFMKLKCCGEEKNWAKLNIYLRQIQENADLAIGNNKCIIIIEHQTL